MTELCKASDAQPAATLLERADDRRRHMDGSRAGRYALTAILALWGFALARSPGSGSWIDNVDLAIHETGHLVFSPFGEFMQFAGGTLFQIIMPAAFVAYFLHRSDRHAASVALWWVAQSFWNISVYVKDARAQELPLVGGGEHDWAYLLSELGRLKQDQQIGRLVWLVGVALYLVSIIGGLVALEKKPATADESGAPATG